MVDNILQLWVGPYVISVSGCYLLNFTIPYIAVVSRFYLSGPVIYDLTLYVLFPYVGVFMQVTSAKCFFTEYSIHFRGHRADNQVLGFCVGRSSEVFLSRDTPHDEVV